MKMKKKNRNTHTQNTFFSSAPVYTLQYSSIQEDYLDDDDDDDTLECTLTMVF